MADRTTQASMRSPPPPISRRVLPDSRDSAMQQPNSSVTKPMTRLVRMRRRPIGSPAFPGARS